LEEKAPDNGDLQRPETEWIGLSEAPAQGCLQPQLLIKLRLNNFDSFYI
jgi:hypothetical protein